jgi:hypothetical protein
MSFAAPLPGDLAKLSVSAKERCDNHPDEQAAWRLTGETDSFGSEYHYLCEACKKKHVQHARENPLVSTCEHCNTENVKVDYWRDPEEGRAGPVYTLCAPCRKKAVAYYSED